MDRIWAHIIGGWAGSLGRAWGAKLVNVSIEYVREVRALLGAAALILVRWVESEPEQDRLVRLGAEGARQWYARRRPEMVAMAARDPNIAFEGLNEVPDELAVVYCAFELERLRLMHGEGLRAVAGNFSVGVPDPPVWAVYEPMLRAMGPGDLLGLHEYWVDHDDLGNPWHVGKWRIVPRLQSVNIVVTECGRDVVERRGLAGWQRSCGTSEFLVDLREYDRIITAAPNVRGACVFQMGSPDPKWRAFDTTPIWPAVVAEYSGKAPAWGAIMPPPVEEEQFMGSVVRLWRCSLNRVDRVEMELYVRGVVPAEMPASWPMEALKAQAVAARTYAVRAIAAPRHAAQGADLCDTAQCQAWTATFHTRTDDAVRATAGETWNDPCQYVSRCGRPDCPLCQGVGGYNGQTWAGRMCQYGARHMAEGGATWREILARYYRGEVAAPVVEMPYLPEFTEAEVWAPLGVVDKTCWWLEEEQRQREAGNGERAQEIRLSLIRWLESRRERLRVA